MICNDVFFMERDQACLLTEQFLVKICQNQHELQNKYIHTPVCSNFSPYELEISGVSWTMDKGKGREKCEAWSSTVFRPCATGTTRKNIFLGKENETPEAPPDHCSWGMFISLSVEEFASTVTMYFSEFWSVTGFALY